MREISSCYRNVQNIKVHVHNHSTQRNPRGQVPRLESTVSLVRNLFQKEEAFKPQKYHFRLFRRRSVVTFGGADRNAVDVQSPNGQRRTESSLSVYSTESKNWIVSTLRKTFKRK